MPKKKTSVLKENPLSCDSKLDISIVQEEEKKEQLLMALNGVSLAELQEQRLAERKKELIAQSTEVDFNNAELINANMESILTAISEPEIFQKLIKTAKIGKDLSELVRAADGLLNIRNKMRDSLIDDYEPQKKSTKTMIRVQLKSDVDGVATADVGVVTNG